MQRYMASNSMISLGNGKSIEMKPIACQYLGDRQKKNSHFCGRIKWSNQRWEEIQTMVLRTKDGKALGNVELF